jgi:catalase (peroxidase I)
VFLHSKRSPDPNAGNRAAEQADWWALAGIVAARRGARKGGQPLTTEFRTGRVDCHTSPNTPLEDDFPDPHGDTATTLDYWVNRFSLTYYETTALIGAHGLGKCHLYV